MAKDKVKNLFAIFSVWSWKHSLLCFCIWLESFLKAHFAAAWRFLMIFLRRFSWSHSWQHFQYFPSFIEFFSIFWLILNHSIIFYVHLITFVSLETLRTLNNTRNWMQRKKTILKNFLFDSEILLEIWNNTRSPYTVDETHLKYHIFRYSCKKSQLERADKFKQVESQVHVILLQYWRNNYQVRQLVSGCLVSLNSA